MTMTAGRTLHPQAETSGSLEGACVHFDAAFDIAAGRRTSKHQGSDLQLVASLLACESSIYDQKVRLLPLERPNIEDASHDRNSACKSRQPNPAPRFKRAPLPPTQTEHLSPTALNIEPHRDSVS
jgi:hypothetical protein